MPPPPATEGFKMIRVTNPKSSLDFYQQVLGMELFDTMKGDNFTLYFLGYNSEGRELTDAEKSGMKFSREGILELTHNHGTESDPNFTGYASGNTDPGRGFGHIAISVPDINAACAFFESLGVPFKKRLTDGKMKKIAFIMDPDGYWVEIVPSGGF